MGDIEKEYWVLLNGTDILGVFETLQECLSWKPSVFLENPMIQRVKKYLDGTFRHQTILLAASVFHEN